MTGQSLGTVVVLGAVIVFLTVLAIALLPYIQRAIALPV